MNEQNLIPNSQRSPNEVRENGRKGGKASGKARRERKALKESLEIILSHPIPKDAEGLKQTLKQYGIVNGDYSQLLMATLVQKALKGDLRALQMVMDIISEDALTKTRIALIEAQTEKLNTSDVDIEDLSDIESRIYDE